ncbi:ROK family transcriptional regulator [Rhizobium sp. K1/93]|nr:ROK family transcriptional regulator [Rhizobium sp. L58/93]MBO9170874.1 ROK family transcriptional regulator [Rhizobium sp. L245/93]MBO9186787.1 ROK family transcriptional regulator [Rhizobium sp. E27B/91]QXZ87477.1 ROK family transcriptional regulator [Rhizobium sp. K1/93]QXZ93503.1 ROK family transcriptional regulator [Rhizobium sp. K15/93]
MKINATVSRALNRRLVLNHLRRQGLMSRAEITAATGLSPAAISFVVAELMDEALVSERQAVVNAKGRPSTPLEINYGSQLALGFKLNRESISAVLTDLATTPLAASEIRISDVTPEGIIGSIVSSIPGLLAKAGRKEAEVMGIGVSIPGEIDPVSGVCIQSPRFGWQSLPLAELLGERVQVPVWIDDDVNAFGIAQKLFGAGRDLKNFAALAIGAGIGCSLVINGDIYHGSRSAAGKLGHFTSVPGGRLCECGRRGCLMAHAAEPYMLDEWERLSGTRISRDDFVSAAAQRSEIALSILSETGTRIGRHLADVVNMFDPEIIVVGGEAAQFGDALLNPIREAMEAYSFFSKPELVLDWVEQSWARGAAALATQNIFDFQRNSSV